MEEKPDKVILLTIDALRYDVIDGDEVETQNIDRLREEGLDFTRAFSHGCGTRMAFPAILYSRKKSHSGRAPESKSMAEHFSEIGYETIGITCNPNTSSYYGYDRGFDDFTDFISPSEEKQEKSVVFKTLKKAVKTFPYVEKFLTRFRAKHSLPYERAEKMNEEVLEALEEGKQFIWAHYMDPHSPYSPPKEYREMCPEAFDRRAELRDKLNSGNVSDEDGELLWELYKAEVKYLDDQLGELFEELPEETLLVFTADHGEGFGEHGQYEHSHYFPENIHVPLTFSHEELTGSEDKLASHLDLIPTIGGLLDQKWSGEGINLMEESRKSILLEKKNRFMIITDEYQLLESHKGDYLYRLDDEIKAEENLYERKSDLVENLKEKHRENSEVEDLDF